MHIPLASTKKLEHDHVRNIGTKQEPELVMKLFHPVSRKQFPKCLLLLLQGLGLLLLILLRKMGIVMTQLVFLAELALYCFVGVIQHGKNKVPHKR